jgi:hypothetical protein
VFTLAEPDVYDLRAAIDLAHQSNLVGLFVHISLVDTDRIDPDRELWALASDALQRIEAVP